MEIRRRPELFESATAWSFERFNLATGGETRFVEGLWADGTFFDTLGVHASLGRAFTPRDDSRGGGPDGAVAVISQAYWQRELGSAPDAIGQPIRLNGVPFTIVGVTGPGFFGLEVGRAFDVIVPISTEALISRRDSVLGEAASNFLTITARLKDGQSVDAAASDLRRVQSAVRNATLGPWDKDTADRYLTAPFTVVPAATGSSSLRRDYQRPLLVIAVIVALVLLIGCLNVANLLLARAIGRRHELSVRVALGASRWRVGRQLFTESVILSMVGAALGVLVAAESSGFLVRQLSSPANPVFLDVSIDGRALAFTALVAIVTTLLFGTAPAFRGARARPMDALRQHGRSSADRSHGRLMGTLVVVQVALSVVLVSAAGLFIRSFDSLANRPLGLQPEPVLVVTIDPIPAGVGASDRVALYGRVREAVLALPDVAGAAISHLTPVGGGGFTPAVAIAPSGAHPAAQLVPTDRDVFGNLVSPGWFDTFGTRLTAGRDFADADRPGMPRVAIVNETFARQFLDGKSPLGRAITVFPNTPYAMRMEVVGVAADAIYSSPREPIPPTWYMPIAQFDIPDYPFVPARLSVRAQSGSPQHLIKSVAGAAATVNPRLALTFRPLAEQLHASMLRERLIAQLAGFLGVLALLLAGLGLYGVTAYAISRRRSEIGIRLALGAAPHAVIRLVLARVSLLVGAGIAAGIGVSLWGSRFVTGLIYDVPPRDPMTLVGAATTLAVLGVLAGWLPARRAARIDPAAVLRS